MSKERFRRDGFIPSWSEVAEEFNLKKLREEGELRESEYNLLQDYYRGHRRIAEGQEVRGKEVLRGLAEKPTFDKLEEKHESILTGIAHFIRSRRERER